MNYPFNVIKIAAVSTDDDRAAEHLFFCWLWVKNHKKTAHFDHIRHENNFEVSTYFLTCSKFKK